MPAELFELPAEVDGVYDVTVSRATPGRRYRCYLLDWDVPTLFDAGFEDSTDVLFEDIDATGLTPERVIVTHEDPDHTGGLAAAVDRYDAESWVPVGDADAIASRWGVDADHKYGDGDRIGPWTAVHVPGHTPGCSALIDEDAGIAVTGDVVFGSDVRGLPTGYLIAPPEYYSDDIAAAERNLENLLGHRFDVALVSHGTAVVEDASAKLERYVQFPGKPPIE